MNGFPGLGFKASLMARRSGGAGASAVNLRASFYVWNCAKGMSDFLFGPGFATLSGDFGRPSVTTWTLWDARIGPNFVEARFAERTLHPIGVASDPGLLRDEERHRAEVAFAAGAVAAVSAIDPGAWALVRFRLWTRPIEAFDPGTQLYKVGHVAEGRPGID